MKKMLFLTDLSNWETEDIITIAYLRNFFDVFVSYLDAIENMEDDFDIIVIRNTRPSDWSKLDHYNRLKQSFLIRAKKKWLNIYNDFDAIADRHGKNYLLELYKNDYPVIPSVDNVADIHTLPASNEYIVKPKSWLNSFGMRTLTLNELKKEKIKNAIIQPKLDFKYEISFYFIDWVLLYCLIFEPSKEPVWPDPKVFNPSKKDLDFAMKFIHRNKLKIWVQRIDAIRLHDDSLLLLEIEDDSPYFALTEIPDKLKKIFLKKLRESIEKQIW